MAKIFPSRTARIILLAMIGVFALLRLILHSFPSANLELGPYNIHHLFVGIILVIGAGTPLILRLPRGLNRWFLAATYGTGLALILDEWVYLIVTEGTDSDYLLAESVYGAVFFIAVVALYVAVLAYHKR